MEDKFAHHVEYRPQWRRVDKHPPPLGAKCLFKGLRGPAVIGIYYPESEWTFWCSLPKHSEEDREFIKSQEG